MSEPIRILTIGHSYCVAANRDLMREVSRRSGVHVTVAAPLKFQGELRFIEMEPEPLGSLIELVGLEVKRSRWIHMFSYDRRQLKDLLHGDRFDVVHAWEEPYIYSGYQIARALQGLRMPFSFSTAQNNIKRYPPPFSGFERKTLAHAKGWTAQAGLVYKAMIRRGYPEQSGRILTLAVDTSRFRPLLPIERAAVRDELGLAPPVIGFMGRLTSEKGLDVLMQALEQLDPAQPWSVLLLGSGIYRRKVETWAKMRGWGERVRIKLVRHDEAPRYLGAMDLLLAPSQTKPNWREQFGRMLVEAFACHVPVIGSDSGEIPNVIGDAGIIVGEKDIAGWSQSIKRLLAEPALRDQLAARGAARVDSYSVQTVADQHLDYFYWLRNQVNAIKSVARFSKTSCQPTAKRNTS